MADGAKLAQLALDKSTNAGAFGDCPKCDKAGFPILPLRFAYAKVDKEYTKYEVDERPSGVSFIGVGELALRPLSDGYLYVLDERNGGHWRAFSVSKEGQLYEFPPKNPPDEKPAHQCGRTDHHVRSSIFTVDKPKEAKRIWMAYSTVRWTPATLDKYKSACLNPKPAQGQGEQPLHARLQMFNVPELMAMDSSTPGAREQVIAIDPEGKNLALHVPEYDGQHARFRDSTVPGFPRQGHAREIGQRMNALMPKRGVALCLMDAVGIGLEIRHYANSANAQVGQVDAKYARELRVDRMLEQVGESFKKSGKQKDWTEDYLSGVDPAKREKFRKDYAQQIASPQAQRQMFCSDFVSWMKSGYFKLPRDHDFDDQDPGCCAAFASQMGSILHGVGLTDNERRFALDSLAKIDNDNLWFRVLTGNQKSLMEYLLKEKQSDLNDILKNTYSALDEWAKGNGFKVYNQLRLAAALRIQTTSQEAAKVAGVGVGYRTAMAVGEAIKSMMLAMQGLLSDAALVSLKQFRVLALSSWLWFNTYAVPVVEELLLSDAIRKQKQAVWGHTLESRLQNFVDAEGTKIARMNVGDVTDELGEAAHIRIRVVTFAFIVAEGSGGRTVIIGRSTVTEVLARLKGSGVVTEAAGALGDPAVAQLARVAPGVNMWDETLKVMRSGGTAGAFAAIAGAFQAVSLGEAYKKYKESPGAKPIWQATAAGIGLVGAIAEVTAASMTVIREMRGVAAASTMPKYLAGGGGVLGGIAGVIAGFITVSEGSDLIKQGDADAGALTRAAGAFVVIGGVAGVAGGLTSLGVGGGVLLGLGPAGWAVLAVGAAIVGLAFLFSAEKVKDNHLQVFIKKSCLGLVSSFNEKAEIAAYADLFKLPLEVKLSWNQSIIHTGATVLVDIDAPALDAKSWLDYELQVYLKDGKVLRAREQRPADSKLPGGTMSDPHRIAWGQAKGLMNSSIGKTDKGGAHWSLSFLTVWDSGVAKVSVLLKYWPNRVESPEVVLPTAAGKLFEITAADAK